MVAGMVIHDLVTIASADKGLIIGNFPHVDNRDIMSAFTNVQYLSKSNTLKTVWPMFILP
jgi:hypothetical protein